MGFKLTKDDLKKAQLCPPGMHQGELIEVEESYLKDNGCEVQKCTFETTKGYQIPVWFNDAVMTNLIEFIEAADKIKFDMENMQDMDIHLKDYLHKPVAFSVSHGKGKTGKVVSNIDNFFTVDSMPFQTSLSPVADISSHSNPTPPTPPLVDDDVPF